MNLLNFVIVLTVTTAIILIVKKLFGMRITPRGHMIIWLVVAVQFLAWPLAEWLPEADWSLKSYVPQVTERHQTTVYGDEDIHSLLIGDEDAIYEAEKTTIEMTMPLGDRSVGMGHTTERHVAEAQRKVILLFWGAVSGLMALRMIVGYLWARKRIVHLPRCDEETAAGRAVMDCFRQMKDTAKVKGKVDLRVGAESTMLAGLLRPTVYLSSELTQGLASSLGADANADRDTWPEAGAAGAAGRLDLAALRCAFAHELTHYRHRDLWLNVAAAAVRCAFWWNPVIHLAFKAFRRDMEVYCDYDAARLVGDKKEYARTLVKAAAGTDRFVLATTSLIGGEKEVSRRVKALAAFKKPKTWIALSALAILLCVCAGLVVNPPSMRRVHISMDNLEDGVLLAYGMNGSGSTADVESRQMDILEDLIDALNEAEMVPSESEVDSYKAFLNAQKPYPVGMGQVWLDIKGGGTHCISYVYGAELDYPVLVELNDGRILLSRDEDLVKEVDDLLYGTFGTSEGMYRSHKLLSEENLVCDGNLLPEEAVKAFVNGHVQKQCIGTSPGGKSWGKIVEFLVRDYDIIQMTERENLLMGSVDYAFTMEHMERFSPRQVEYYGNLSSGDGEYEGMAVGTTRFVLLKDKGGWYLSQWGPDCWLASELGVRDLGVPGVLEEGKVYGAAELKFLSPLSSASKDAAFRQLREERYRWEDGAFIVEKADGSIEIYEDVYIREKLLLNNICWYEEAEGVGEQDMAFELDPKYSGGESREYWVYSGGKHGGNGDGSGAGEQQSGETGQIGYRFYYLVGEGESELWMGVFTKTPHGGWNCWQIVRLQVM